MIDIRPPYVFDLELHEQNMFVELFKHYRMFLTRNQLRRRYYEGKNVLHDLGISIPPSLRNIETVVGWPAISVDSLAVRSIFDGFVFQSHESTELTNILRANDFKSMYLQTSTSELIYSCAFLTVSKGDIGEPDVLVSAYSAENAVAIWDYRRHRIKYGMTVVDIDKDKNPTQYNLYTDTHIIEVINEGGVWHSYHYPHRLGRPLMEALVYRPSIDRPFGKSRVSRAVMSITDSAVRSALRSEVGAEFYTAPQKYLLGADDEVFYDIDGNPKSKWEAYIGNIIAISTNEEGDMPQFGQLSQGSMSPHTEYMRSLASRFSGETKVPISELGIIHDNPTSAEAIYAAKEPLVVEAERLNDTNGRALENIGMMILAIAQNKTIEDLSDAEKSITANFRDPARPSLVTQADAMTKFLSAQPEYAGSDVILEKYGLSNEEIMRLQAYKKKNEALSVLDRLVGNDTSGNGEQIQASSNKSDGVSNTGIE